eukprot:TRINITY_DN40472_c0_g1_i1.p1 TRINITY_DN40472_c0_g1~~TRINITY_DN40472_c0_g1_i1.p1  ORF type:complete len:323 (+),score=66.03 TRINITY_DN40472_c0_g1_i1:127-1095(+)
MASGYHDSPLESPVATPTKKESQDSIAESSSRHQRDGNAERALWLMLGVNGILTGTQIACGILANSLSLLGDGMLMAMDGVSYAVSLYVERRKHTAEDSERMDRMSAMFSAVMLGAATIWMLYDSIDRLVVEYGASEELDGSTGEEEVIEVNSLIMIVFTAVNLAADILVAFCIRRCGASAVLAHADDTDANMNLFGALAHLAADGVRGLAVLLCGILAQAGLVVASEADAYCTLFVCIFVLAATVSLLKKLLKKSIPSAYVDLEETGPEAERSLQKEEDESASVSSSPQSTVEAVSKAELSKQNTMKISSVPPTQLGATQL